MLLTFHLNLFISDRDGAFYLRDFYDALLRYFMVCICSLQFFSFFLVCSV